MPILGTLASQFSGKPFGSFESIATATLNNSGEINFTSIPSTYAHLQIRFFGKDNPIGDQMSIRFGSSNTIDTGSNYAFHNLGARSSTVSTFDGSPNNVVIKFAYGAGGPQGSSPETNVFNSHIIDILDYANTNKYKTLRSLGGYARTGSGSYNAIDYISGHWRSFNAINCIRFNTNNFGTVGTIALYGIKGS